jgi:hypothetical protein
VSPPLLSWELRWFVPGEPAPAATSLFGEPDWASVPTRTDSYVALPTIDDLGIKRREGRLEVKGRIAVIPSVRCSPCVEGRLEHWIKWSHEGAVLDPVVEALSKGPLDAVTKQRIQRKFHLQDGRAEEVALDLRLDGGAYAELTRLELAGSRWWSLGFEAFPNDSALPDELLALVRRFLGEASIELTVEQSLSYPAWLVEYRTS